MHTALSFCIGIAIHTKKLMKRQKVTGEAGRKKMGLKRTLVRGILHKTRPKMHTYM